MREVHLQLPAAYQRYLAEQAAYCDVTEGEIVAMALSILVAHRQAERAGAGIFMAADPSRPPQALSINVSAVASPDLADLGRVRLSEAGQFRIGLDTIGGDEGPHLRLV